jgi:outer membrane protein assembly factor BamB
MRPYLYFLVLLLSGLPRLGQAQTPVIAWQQYYGTTGDDETGLAVAMPAGGYLVLGRQPTLNNTIALPFVVCTNAQGTQLWTKSIPLDVNTAPRPRDIMADGNGNTIFAGLEGNGLNGFLVKLDAAGDTVWTNFQRNTALGAVSGIFRFPTLAPDGNYVATHTDYSYLSPVAFYSNQLVKVSAATGATLWTTPLPDTVGNVGLYSIAGMARTTAGYLVFMWGYDMTTMLLVHATVLVDANGQVLRVRSKVDAEYNDYVRTTLTADGNIVSARRQTVTKFTPTGDTLWHTVVPSRYTSRVWRAAGVVESSRGELLVAADSELYDGFNPPSSNQIHMVRFSAQGRLLGDTMLYRGGNSYARSAILAPDGLGLVFSGYTDNGPYGGLDLLLGRYQGFRVLGTAAPAPLAAGRLVLVPNPASGAAPVRAELPATAAGGMLRLYDALGRQLQQAVPLGQAAPLLPVDGLAAGLYVLRYQLPDGRHWSTRLLRE